MIEQLSGTLEAIENNELPDLFDRLFSKAFDKSNGCFKPQETAIIDYKEDVPLKNDEEYRLGILSLISSYYNTFGGLIVFGVRNDDFQVVGLNGPDLDIEYFNRSITDFYGIHVELKRKHYDLSIDGSEKRITVLLVPRRTNITPARLKRDFKAKYKKDALFVRDRHETRRALYRHLPLLFSPRDTLLDTAGDSQHVAHKSFPPFPGTMKEFIGRFELGFKLWDWFIFGRNPRLYLSGPGGSGKSTLAFEFAEKVADNAPNLVFSNGEKVDYVLFLSAKETEFNVISASEQSFQPRQFTNAREMCKQILIHSGLHSFETISGKSEVENLELLDELFDNFNGLIVLDDIDALSRSGVDTGEEELFLKASQARKTTKIVYTVRGEASYAKNASIPVPGLAEDSEFPEFLSKCC